MKKALLGIALLNLLFACSKKDKVETVPELPPEKIVVARITEGNDSLVMKYDNEGRVIRFADWTGNTADSFEVAYLGGSRYISEFKFFAFSEKRIDRKFVYDGIVLTGVNYYNLGSNGEPVITDKDSLVYKDGRLAEYHEISGGVRSSVYKLTWQYNDVSKAEYFLVNGNTEIPVSVNTYAYNDMPGHQHMFKGDFLLRYEKHSFSHLSMHAVIKDEQKAAGSGVPIYSTVYTPSYDQQGLPKEVVIVKNDKQSNETTTTTLKLEYITLQ